MIRNKNRQLWDMKSQMSDIKSYCGKVKIMRYYVNVRKSLYSEKLNHILRNSDHSEKLNQRNNLGNTLF